MVCDNIMFHYSSGLICQHLKTIALIKKYNPLHPPDPGDWLALDEEDRIELVYEYHAQSENDLANMYLHSTIHAVIEYQIALGDEYPVQETLNRLTREGLDRHDAIHAIGSVLIKYIWEVGTGKNATGEFSRDYFDEVSELTAQKWFEEFG